MNTQIIEFYLGLIKHRSGKRNHRKPILLQRSLMFAVDSNICEFAFDFICNNITTDVLGNFGQFAVLTMTRRLNYIMRMIASSLYNSTNTILVFSSISNVQPRLITECCVTATTYRRSRTVILLLRCFFSGCIVVSVLS